MANVLIIDDDQGMCYTLSNMVKHFGHEVTCEHTLKSGCNKAASGVFDIVFLDVMMPDGSGLDVLPNIKEAPGNPEVIIITGLGNADGAEIAIINGAWDYIEKPSYIKEMRLPLFRALQYRKEKMTRKKAVSLKRERIIGTSSQMTACLDLLAQAADSDVNVLITGETGTGKELFANAIHENSARSKNDFVVVDCAALPETLVESVLFGHVKGAFTGADRAKEGLIKQADGGTLFLDEVGELPLSTQKAFLRVLHERRFRPVGGKEEVFSDFRLIAATNRDLDKMLQAGQFRKDLMFRLKSLTIPLPPLRERQEDIKKLTMHITTLLCEKYGTGTKGFSTDFFEALTYYSWPGNVRELFSAMERSFLEAKHESTLFPNHLPVDIRIEIARTSAAKNNEDNLNGAAKSDESAILPKMSVLRQSTEKKYLEDLVQITKGDVKKACQISDLSRSRYYELLKKHNITILAS